MFEWWVFKVEWLGCCVYVALYGTVLKFPFGLSMLLSVICRPRYDGLAASPF